MTPTASSARTSYRQVLAQPGTRLWYITAALTRAPVVMAPLALVFAGYSAGSFTLGGTLAAVYALGEAAAAPMLGRWFDTRPFVPLLRWTLTANAISYAALAIAAGHSPAAVLIFLAAFAGATGSGAPGGMRAQLSATIPPTLRTSALSLDTSLSQAVRAAAPPLASGLYALSTASGTLIAMAFFVAIPAAAAHRIPHTPPPSQGQSDQQHAAPGVTQILRHSWTTALLSAAIMFLIGTVDILLPARLKAVGSSPALAGPVLAAFAVTSIIAGLVYGARTWPGGARAQSACMLLIMTAVLAVPGLTGHPLTYALVFALAGTLYSPLLTIRNIALQEQLPETAWATGFSILYAAAGLGYGVAGLLAATLLDMTTSSTAFLTCTAATLILGVIALAAEPTPTPDSPSTKDTTEPRTT
ncbi:MFS transporter [Streptomyces sp. NPDC058294]|uniref:MFS transporter n=1 Tax=Streptomyces sp. NPDC058294 TaxID=3346430 RepID=UPI0036F08490